ncbi:hypothetical protein KJ671_00430 [Patescibacteria group bacterium]|nr:hypothetical protein [Patescibacteria group bacterium]
MTIIEPNKSKYSYNPIILTLSVFLVALVCLNICFYNNNVVLKQSISIESKNLQKLQVANAEIKDQLYKITDINNMNSVIEAKNLVKDRNPEYFKNESEILAIN